MLLCCLLVKKYDQKSETNMRLLYPTSLVLDVDSLKGFAPTLHSYDPKQLIPNDLIDAEILVTWTNSADNLKDAAKRMQSLKWIQSLAAGPNDVRSFKSTIIAL